MIEPIEIDKIAVRRLPALAAILNRVILREGTGVDRLQMTAGQPPWRLVIVLIRFRPANSQRHRINSAHPAPAEKFFAAVLIRLSFGRLRRHKTMAQRVFRDRSRFEELKQVIRPARFGANAGKFEPTERLRSEEHTSELQSPYDLVCRLLLEKKK